MVSVIIPNYNHATYLRERIESILNQTYQNFELIILDDYSNDDSKLIIEEYRNHEKISHIIYNETNSGSTFYQWKKGINLAKGEYIWIAESDDVAEDNFLKTLYNLINANSDVGIAYCNSKIIDSSGQPTTISGISQTPRDLEKRYSSSYVNNGVAEILNHLIDANRIPNASAVLFKRHLVEDTFYRADLKLYGDWCFWVSLLRRTKIGYSSETLNLYRTHKGTVRKTKSSQKKDITEYYKVIDLLISFSIMSKEVKKKLADNIIYRYNKTTDKSNYLWLETLKTIIKLNPLSPFTFLKSQRKK